MCLATNRQKQSMKKQSHNGKSQYPQCNSLSPKSDPQRVKMTKFVGQHNQQSSQGTKKVLVKQLIGPNNDNNFSKMVGTSEASSRQNPNLTIDNSVDKVFKR